MWNEKNFYCQGNKFGFTETEVSERVLVLKVIVEAETSLTAVQFLNKLDTKKLKCLRS